jgi:hypothetical protein
MPEPTRRRRSEVPSDDAVGGTRVHRRDTLPPPPVREIAPREGAACLRRGAHRRRARRKASKPSGAVAVPVDPVLFP